MGSWIWISNFVLFVINGLIKGGLRNQVVSFLVWCDESLTSRALNSNLRHFGSFTFILVSCGESRLLVSWCVGDRCDMAGSDEDSSKSRRSGAEDQVWSSTGRVLGVRTIGMSGDAMFGLHHARGDEECVFLGWASKPRLTVSRFGPQNQ
jgi:hypothetical protein